MKRIFLLHGWGAKPESEWYTWMKKELEKKGYKVIVPEMPNTEEPDINEWVSHLKKIVGKLDGNTCFIGHSIGCQTIMRYLEGQDYQDKIGKVFFVAGWFKLKNLEDYEIDIAKPWLDKPIDFMKVKKKINELVVFLSTNEPYNYVKENKIIFEEKLGAKVFVLKDKGHFTKEDGVLELDEVLDIIK